MKFVYFDASSGLSGDMILGALLDLGADPDRFRKEMGRLKLPVRIDIRETERSHLRALKVDVRVERKRPVTRNMADIEKIIDGSPFPEAVRIRRPEDLPKAVRGRSPRPRLSPAPAHLHEAGADDALVDVLGACWLAEKLDIGAFYLFSAQRGTRVRPDRPTAPCPSLRPPSPNC